MGIRSCLGGLVRMMLPERIPGFAVPLYEKGARSARGRYYARVAEEIVARIDAGRILDVGTGPGYLPIEIAKRCPSVQIKGIDLSRKMIELARRNAQEAGVSEQLSFELGNANRLRFEDGLFDMVISTGVFHSWRRPVRAINEIYRVLRPAGLALIYDPAQVFTDEEEILDYCQGWCDRMALRWARLASSFTYPRIVVRESVEKILSMTRFQHWEIECQGHLRLVLYKERFV